MLKPKCVLILIILFFSFTIINLNINSSPNTRQNPNDWIIIQSTNIQDQVKILNGNLTITGTGSLTLNNVTLIMNCSFDGEYHIEVRAIGELNLINNSTIKSNNSTFRYDFYYLKNSRGTISNSTIMNAGWDYFAGSRGLFIESDFITVEDSTFDNNYIDIWCEDSSPTIKFNKILTEFDSYSEPGERFQLGGIDLIGGKPKIFNNLISNSISGISFEASSSPLIINNFIKNSSYDGISCGYESSYPIIENNTIISCGSAGIGIWAAYPILRNNTISDCDYGIWINTYWTYILTPIIENCTISDSKINDLYIEDNCHPIFINGTFNKKNVCFKFDRSYNPSLTLQWYLKVKILDENNNSIRNASVIIKELKVNEIYNDTTDSNGYTGLITCTEYIQQDKNNDTDGNDPGEKDYHTPHNITVSIEYKGGIYKFYQDIFMDKSKNITIKINTSNIKNLTPDLTISYQDIIFSNNTPIEGDIVRINATIYNQGKTKVDKAEIKFYDNNITLENQIGDLPNIKNLNPNNRTQVTIDWNTTAKIGNHTIYVVIENSNPCEEYIDNNIAFKNITIKLKNQNPNADISCNKSIGYTNEEMIFNGSASYDPDGYIQAYYFDFGDGNSSNWTSKQIVTHNYSMQGKYVASLKVRDNEDVESDNLAQIEITINKRNHMPIIENISVNPLIIEPNGKAIITVDAFDPDFDGLDYLYETTEGIILGDGCNVTWQAPEIEGEYTINVKVFDGRAYSKSTSVNITVRKNNTAPIITDITTNPSEVNPRGTSVIIINVSDPDIGDTLTFYYNVTGGYIEGNGATVTWHAPDNEGTYIITITVIDLAGEDAKDTVSIIVQEQSDAVKEKDGFFSDLNTNLWLIFILCLIILIIIILLILKKQKSKSIKSSKEEAIEVESIEELEE